MFNVIDTKTGSLMGEGYPVRKPYEYSTRASAQESANEWNHSDYCHSLDYTPNRFQVVQVNEKR